MKQQENQLWFVKPIFVIMGIIFVVVAGYYFYQGWTLPTPVESQNSEAYAVGWCKNLSFTTMALYPEQLSQYNYQIQNQQEGKCKNIYVTNRTLQNDSLMEYDWRGDCKVYNQQVYEDGCKIYGGAGDVQPLSSF